MKSMTQLVVITAWIAASCQERDDDARDDAKRSRPRPTELMQPAQPNWGAAFKYAARWDSARESAVVDVTIAPGFHAYAEGETVGKPLALEPKPDSPLKLAGPVSMPKGVVKELPIGRSVIVEGSAEIVAPIADPAPGKALEATFRYQVCTPDACDRPRSVDLSVPAS